MRADVVVVRTFVTVMEAGSVIGASKVCDYSPAAISRQLSMWQHRLGVRLFVPDGRSIRPTAAAFELLAPARKLLEEMDLFAERASLLGAGV